MLLRGVREVTEGVSRFRSRLVSPAEQAKDPQLLVSAVSSPGKGFTGVLIEESVSQSAPLRRSAQLFRVV